MLKVSVLVTSDPDKHMLSEDEKKTQEYVVIYSLLSQKV